MQQRVIEDTVNDCTVTYFPKWLPVSQTEPLITQMELELLPLMTHDRGFNRFTGKEWISQRLVATISTGAGVEYQYGTAKKRVTCQTTFDDLPWLDELRRQAETLCGHELNFVFCNFYRPNTEDNLGWHSDSEKEMVPGSAIVSMSFGDTRDFAFRRKAVKGEKSLTIPLANGDVVIMAGNTQKFYEHSVTKKGAKKCTKGRWNLTFRRFAEQTNKKRKV